MSKAAPQSKIPVARNHSANSNGSTASVKSVKLNKTRRAPDFSKLHKKWTDQLQEGMAQAKKPVTVPVELDVLKHEPRQRTRSQHVSGDSGQEAFKPDQQSVSEILTQASSRKPLNQKPVRQTLASSKPSTSRTIEDGNTFKSDIDSWNCIMNGDGLATPKNMSRATDIAKPTYSNRMSIYCNISKPRAVAPTTLEQACTYLTTQQPRTPFRDLDNVVHNASPFSAAKRSIYTRSVSKLSSRKERLRAFGHASLECETENTLKKSLLTDFDSPAHEEERKSPETHIDDAYILAKIEEAERIVQAELIAMERQQNDQSLTPTCVQADENDSDVAMLLNASPLRAHRSSKEPKSLRISLSPASETEFHQSKLPLTPGISDLLDNMHLLPESEQKSSFSRSIYCSRNNPHLLIEDESRSASPVLTNKVTSSAVLGANLLHLLTDIRSPPSAVSTQLLGVIPEIPELTHYSDTLVSEPKQRSGRTSPANAAAHSQWASPSPADLMIAMENPVLQGQEASLDCMVISDSSFLPPTVSDDLLQQQTRLASHIGCILTDGWTGNDQAVSLIDLSRGTSPRQPDSTPVNAAEPGVGVSACLLDQEYSGSSAPPASCASERCADVVAREDARCNGIAEESFVRRIDANRGRNQEELDLVNSSPELTKAIRCLKKGIVNNHRRSNILAMDASNSETPGDILKQLEEIMEQRQRLEEASRKLQWRLDAVRANSAVPLAEPVVLGNSNRVVGDLAAVYNSDQATNRGLSLTADDLYDSINLIAFTPAQNCSAASADHGNHSFESAETQIVKLLDLTLEQQEKRFCISSCQEKNDIDDILSVTDAQNTTFCDLACAVSTSLPVYTCEDNPVSCCVLTNEPPNNRSSHNINFSLKYSADNFTGSSETLIEGAAVECMQDMESSSLRYILERSPPQDISCIASSNAFGRNLSSAFPTILDSVSSVSSAGCFSIAPSTEQDQAAVQTTTSLFMPTTPVARQHGGTITINTPDLVVQIGSEENATLADRSVNLSNERSCDMLRTPADQFVNLPNERSSDMLKTPAFMRPYKHRADTAIQHADDTPLRISLFRTSQRFRDALLDDEVAIYMCRSVSSGVTARSLSNPVARLLMEGDDQHFIPISLRADSLNIAGSAFHCFTP